MKKVSKKTSHASSPLGTRVIRNPRPVFTPAFSQLFSFSLALLLVFSQGFAADTPAEAVKIETFKTHSRLAVQVDENVPVEWKNNGTSFELRFKGISLADLGAPLGEEANWKSRIESLPQNMNDPRIAALKVSEAGGDLRITGQWKFPAGKAALADPKMESFDYRDRKPAQYVIDLWLKKGPTLAEVQAARKQAEHLAALKEAETKAKQRAERRLASQQRKQENEDLGRFCRQPLSEADIFLPFLPVHEEVNYSRWISTTTPDSNFSYFEPKSKDRDAQYVRLALQLYRQGKPALVLKTLEFHATEHPHSPYRQEMRFLRANALLKLGLEREGEQLLMALMTEAKESPEALHSGMFLAAKQAGQKSHLAALESFLWLMNTHAGNSLNWLFHLGAAEAYRGMRQIERAAKEYQWVMEFAKERSARAEGAGRLGDLYLEKLQYEQALAAYFQGLNYFGQELETYPAIHINRAETLYQLGELERAKNSFAQFLEKYPAHPAGWRATFRLGEILSRAGNSAGRKFFYETINRYPYSPGATLARVRLIPCEDHGGFNPESGERFFLGEGAKFEGRGEVVTDRYREFLALARVKALIAWNRDDAAVEAAVAEIDANKSAAIRPALNSMLSVLYRRRIEELLAEGKAYEAIAFYQKKASYLPEEARDAEPQYLLALSRAATDLGMGKLGEELVAAYRRASGARKLASAPADSEEMDHRILVSEEKFTEARALWIASGANEADRVQALLKDVMEESKFSFEREIILGLVADAKGRVKDALAHAARAQVLKSSAAPSSGGTRSFRLEAWLASLEAKAGDHALALEMYRNVEKSLGKGKGSAKEGDVAGVESVLGVPAVPSRQTLILAQAELLEKLSRWGEAATAYARVLEDREAGETAASQPQAAYGYARALIRSGSRDRGLEILGRLAEGKPVVEKPATAANGRAPAQSAPAPQGSSDFWRKLAQETLANEIKGSNQSSDTAKEGRQ